MLELDLVRQFEHHFRICGVIDQKVCIQILKVWLKHEIVALVLVQPLPLYLNIIYVSHHFII